MAHRRSTVRRAMRTALVVPLALALLGLTAPAGAQEGSSRATVSKVRDITTVLRGNYPGTHGSRASFASPTVADVNGDGIPEIVTATVDGRVIAYTASGGVRWFHDAGRTSIQSAPAVADITGDGRADVVVGTMDGRVLLLNGPDGRLLRTFGDGGLQGCRPTCFPRGFHATPAIGDVNGDGIKDIVASSYNHHIYAWSRGGTVLFIRNHYDTIWSSPAVVDIDGDGRNEVIVGGDVHRSNPVLGGPDGGMVWVIRRTGSGYGNYPGYPKRFTGQTIWSSPAIADVNGDGNLDIIVGTGIFYPDPAGRRLIAITARTGANLSGWPAATQGRVLGSPAVGNVAGDAKPEVAVVSEGGYLHMFNTNGSRRWMVCDRAPGAACATGVGTFSSPVLADVDDDGQVEVITATENHLRIRNGATGAVEAEHSLRSTDGNATVHWASPTVAEIDGRTTIVYQAHVRRGHAEAYAKANDYHRLQVLTTGTQLCHAPWPTFKGGPDRNGRSWESTNPQWLPFRCPGDFVEQQYRDFLGRSPDASGRSYWSNMMRLNGKGGPWIIAGFLRSPEFANVVAPVVRVSLGLHGAPPPNTAGVRADTARIRAGTPIATIAQEKVAADPTLSGMSDDDFITRIYRNLYGRAPTADERNADRDRLTGGMTRGAVLTRHSDGAAAAGLRSEVDVAMAYLGMLGRVPEPSGFAYWVGEVDRLGINRLLWGIQVSAEYRNRVT